MKLRGKLDLIFCARHLDIYPTLLGPKPIICQCLHIYIVGFNLCDKKSGIALRSIWYIYGLNLTQALILRNRVQCSLLIRFPINLLQRPPLCRSLTTYSIYFLVNVCWTLCGISFWKYWVFMNRLFGDVWSQSDLLSLNWVVDQQPAPPNGINKSEVDFNFTMITVVEDRVHIYMPDRNGLRGAHYI